MNVMPWSLHSETVDAAWTDLTRGWVAVSACRHQGKLNPFELSETLAKTLRLSPTIILTADWMLFGYHLQITSFPVSGSGGNRSSRIDERSFTTGAMAED